MLRPRIIPCLLLSGSALVKTVRFTDPMYIGDPVNTVHIFNEENVDELIVLDITQGDAAKPQLEILDQLAGECFMPLTVGGNIKTMDDIAAILALGIEKVSLNTACITSPSLLTQAAEKFGNQSIVASMDVRSVHGTWEVFLDHGRVATGIDAVTHAKEMERLGAGELLITSIDRDGTMEGYDLRFIQAISNTVDIPIIACGGAKDTADLSAAVRAGASASAAGSLFLYQGKGRGVLVHFPPFHS